jgi:tRNA(fMet)-specific endonuclease VapC
LPRVSRTFGEELVCTSIIVAAEQRDEAARKGSARLRVQLLTVLDVLEILPFETPSEITYGDLRARLEAAGKPIAVTIC